MAHETLEQRPLAFIGRVLGRFECRNAIGLPVGIVGDLLPGMEQEAAARTDEALKKALSE